MNILKAPIEALYSIPFYRRVSQASLGYAFLYLLYLSLIGSIILTFGLVSYILPKANPYIEWIQQEMPPLVWTPQGLSMKTQSPYNLYHEPSGFLITFDMTKTTISQEEMGNSKIFVTSQKIFVKQENQTRIYDVTQTANPNVPQNMTMVINDETVQNFYNMVKPWFVIVAVLFFFIFFFMWKVFAGLFYSIFGLIMNLLRAQKLSYSSILSLSYFSMTAATLVLFVRILLMPMVQIPFGVLLSMLLTCSYIFIAIKGIEEMDSESANPGRS